MSHSDSPRAPFVPGPSISHTLLVALTTIALPLSASIAQVLPANPTPVPAPTGPSTNTTTISGQPSPSSSGQMLGNDIPFLDPSTGTVTFDGKMWNLMDNPLIRTEFERYLNLEAADSELDQEYRKTFRLLLDELSPHNTPDIAAAVALLEKLATFDQDDYLCETLSNAVYNVVQAKKGNAALAQLNRELEGKRRQLDWDYEKLHDESGTKKQPTMIGRNRQQGNNQQGGNQGGGQEDDSAGQAGSKNRVIQRTIELEAERLANKAKMEASDLAAKVYYQAMILQFLGQRRYEHVIAACRIYTQMFSESAVEKIEIQQGSDAEKLFSESLGTHPTITSMDSLANELIAKVDDHIESFNYLVAENRIHAATEELFAAFSIGEHLPALRTLERDKKQKVSAYTRSGNRLLASLEVRDYAQAEELINAMRQEATDFDYTKPQQAVTVAQQTSNMHIQYARNAAIKQEEEKAVEHFTKAAEIWPSNPELKKQFDIVSQQSDIQQMAKLEFDRLISTQSYRQIFNDKGRFIAATIDDPERQQTLQTVLENIQKIEIAMQQAEALARGGNHFGAWETVEQVFKEFPDDQPLGTKRSDLATEVSEFVGALKKAENLERDDQLGSSLTWYLRSRKLYPNSIYAREGIDRLVDRILPDDAGDTRADTPLSTGSDRSTDDRAPLFGSESASR